MKRIFTFWTFICLTIHLMAVSTGFYNIKEYGAEGDGVHIDSPAINAAIEAAHVAGGGTVYFPAGTYLSYSIRLKDNISLYPRPCMETIPLWHPMFLSFCTSSTSP